MVDVSETMGNKFLDATMVEESPTKELVIKTEPLYETGMFGKKLQCTVVIDGASKVWKINPQTQENIAMKHTTNSEEWIGKVIKLETKMIKNNHCIIGVPA